MRQHFYRVVGIGDSLIKAKADGHQGWVGRLSSRVANEKGHRVNYVNQGEGGDTTVDVLARLGTCLDVTMKWDLLVIGVGINDSRRRGWPPNKYEVSVENTVRNWRQILDQIETSQKIQRIIVAGLTPVIESKTTPLKEDKYYFNDDIAKYGMSLRELIERRSGRAWFVDFSKAFKVLSPMDIDRFLPDGLHPGPIGYQFMADYAWQVIGDKL